MNPTGTNEKNGAFGMSIDPEHLDGQQYDVLSPAHIQDPFPLYAQLREEHPIYWDRKYSFWLLTRYADVKTALQAPTRFSSATGTELERRADKFPARTRKNFDIAYRILFKSLVASDAPRHTRDRQAVMKAFTPRVITEMREAISQRVERLLDLAEQSGTFDFVKQFAYPLPSLVIFDLLGVPQEFHHIFRDASSAVLKFSPTVFRNDLAKLEQIAESISRADSVMASLIFQRRTAPQRDLISLLVHELDGALSDEEIGVLCNLLVVAGHETTANLLGGSLRFLLQKRELWEQLREQPELIGNAVEELVRFVSPVLWISRIPSEDIELQGHVLQKGSRVLLGIGSANHDPLEFSDPETLDVGRSKAHSLAFGHGPHYCIGAALAKMEAEIALSALLRRMPHIQLATETFEYEPTYAVRSLKALPVSI